MTHFAVLHIVTLKIKDIIFYNNIIPGGKIISDLILSLLELLKMHNH